jgi:uncharacterized membrane protein (DUF4010 family)
MVQGRDTETKYPQATSGGLVNSTAAVAERSGPLAAMGNDGRDLAIVVNRLTVVAMFSRNLVLLAIFSPRAGILAAAPFALMVLGTTGFIWWSRRSTMIIPDLKLGSPYRYAR